MANMPIPTLEDMRDQALDDMRLAAIEAGVADPPVEEGSDWYARATAFANLQTILCSQMSAAESDWDPRACSDARIEQWRITLNLPEVRATGSTGKVLARLDAASGTVTNGTVLLRSGYQYQVIGNYYGVTDDTELNVEAIDTGTVTNVPAGTRLEWRTSPPGFKSYVDVSVNEPLAGATDAETAEQKRERVLTRLGNPPASGNWAAVREAVSNALSTVEAYVYPGLGWASSSKIVLTKGIDPDNRDFSRIPTSGQLAKCRAAIWSVVADGTKHVIRATAEEPTSVTLQVDIPDASTSGGDGSGWLNDEPWPQLVVGDSGKVVVSAVSTSRTFTLSAGTTTPPVDGQTLIVWWSPGDQKFYTGLVISHSGSTGAWVVTVNAPFVDADNTTIAVGDYIGPAAAKTAEYGDKWRELMAQLGPGENTTDSLRLPRAARHPAVDAQDSPSLTAAQKKAFQNAFAEVADVDYGYRSSTTPTIPSSVLSEPYTLTLDNFGIYPL